MSKRNFILLITILVIILITVFGFLSFKGDTTPTSGVDGGNNFFAQFNPFGGSKNTGGNSNDGDNGGDNTDGESPVNDEVIKLIKVSSMPVAGYTTYTKERLKEVPIPEVVPVVEIVPTETKTKTQAKATAKPTPPPTEFVSALRYVARENGHVYQTFVDKIEEKLFTTTTIPQVYDSYIGNKAMSIIMRYLKADNQTIETYLGLTPTEVLGGDTTTTELTGTLLPDNITDISLSPDKQKAFYLFNLNENSVGTILNFADSKKTQIFTSPFTEWLTSWPNNSLITLTTNPASTVPGYMYMLNTTTKNLSQVMGNINGLTTLTSPDGKLVLYGNNNGLLYVYHTDTRNSELLGVKTIPEKCTWSKAGYILFCAVPINMNGFEFPDNWYRGEVSFSDQIWKIDMNIGTTSILLDPTSVTGGEDTDGIKLSVDDKEEYLFFVNKKDSFLWEFSLK